MFAYIVMDDTDDDHDSVPEPLAAFTDQRDADAYANRWEPALMVFPLELQEGVWARGSAEVERLREETKKYCDSKNI